MLCGPVTMKDTSYEPSLWNRKISDNEIMYKEWGFHGSYGQQRVNDWDQVKLNLSRFSQSLVDVRERVPTAAKIESQDCFQSERKALSNWSSTTEIGAREMERPQFQITIEQPIRHVTPSSASSVTFPLWSKPRGPYGKGRRSSDGLLATAIPFSGRKAMVFSTLSEEHSANEHRSAQTVNNCNSRVSTLNCRRFSDGCFRSVPSCKEFRKVSVVLPQPRRSVNVESVEESNTEDFPDDKKLQGFESADGSENEEDDRWKELVAKAQGFKSGGVNGAGKPRGLQLEDVKENVSRSSEMEEAYSDISSEASFSSSSTSYHSSSDSDSQFGNARTFNPMSGEVTNCNSTEGHTSGSSKAAVTIRRASIQPKFNGFSGINHTRRYSVATFSPTRSFDATNTAKLSGYSTQSALEQARQLLSRLQSEGKNKNKKERLEELSTALKWILEELNRIETPDRQLVSLFISLRAKIVNLKADLKSEEFDATCVDPAEIGSALPMQKLMTEASIDNACSRRFSWC